MHSSMGQEFVLRRCLGHRSTAKPCFCLVAAHALSCATHDTDRVLFRDLRPYLRTGEGRVARCNLAAPDRDHAVERVVATQIPVAVGSGFANLLLGPGRNAVSFFGAARRTLELFLEEYQLGRSVPAPRGCFVCEATVSVDTARARQRHVPLGAPSRLSRRTPTRTTRQSRASYSLARKRPEGHRLTVLPLHSSNITCCRYLEHVGIGTDWNWDIATRRPSSATGSSPPLIPESRNARSGKPSDERNRDRRD